MRLKSIKLAGFKSFVDATTVPFPTNMTAVVGPNGCGKSNIIDAVRWVMGESSAKNLRGEAMTDVIFNGSTGRQPVGQASIELLFDNTMGKLTGEYAAFSEISIKRKVTREGISQYYLNGTKCRRRDVTDIFLGTGMGPRSYAIIEQGMIARLIESKPEELRVYLEEAAGISKYKERRRETENRMRRTQENLDRLTDIRDELDKQLQHLKRQASAAEKYAEFKKQERLCKAQLNALKWQELEAALKDQNREISQLEVEIERAVKDKTSSQSQIESKRLELEEKQAAFNRVQAKYYESGAEIAKIEQRLKYQKERLAQQDEELARLGEQKLAVAEKLEDHKAQLIQIEDELGLIQPELEEAEAAAAELEEQLQSEEEAMQRWQQDWDQFNGQAASARQTAELEQNVIQQAEARLQQLAERHEKLQTEQRELEAQDTAGEDEGISEQLAEFEERLAACEEAREQLRIKKQALQQELGEKQKTKSGLERDISEKRAVLSSLKTLQAADLGDDTEAEIDWLNKNGIEDVQRLMANVVIEPEWEKAIEHVLQPFQSSVQVTGQFLSHVDAADVAHPFSFIVQDSTAQPEKKARQNKSLADCIQGAEALEDYLAHIIPVEQSDDYLTIQQRLESGQTAVMPDGTWIGPGWVNFYRPGEEQSGYLARGERIRTIENELVTLEAALEELVAELEARLSVQVELDDQLADHEHQSRALQQDANRLASEQSASRAKQEQYALRLKRNREDLSEVELNQELETERLAEAREAWQTAMSSLDLLTDEKEKRLTEKERIQTSLTEKRESARQSQARSHQLQLSQQKQISQQQLLEQAIRNLQQDSQRITGRLQSIDETEKVDEGDLSALELELEGLLDSRVRDEEKLAESRREMEAVTVSLRDIEHGVSSRESEIQAHRMKLEQHRMECQALQINQRNLVEAIEADDFDVTDLLEEMAADVTNESLNKTLESLAQRIQRLGAINLAAVDEFKTQSERKEYLDQQNEDLTEALDTLVNAIRKIDRETRARFKETYELVNEGLKRLFPKIFGGGSAQLELTDDDLLETGVAIIARPPGKKNSTIHLLSGGEKALTAIALIFAIFELNPAPFCMLDEVDAPLDDANVGRFANMVKEMSDNVQFIYISHNKVSMEMADQLMGVTMNEPGVSRLVSVDVDEAAALAEA